MKAIFVLILYIFIVNLCQAQSTFVKEFDLNNHSYDNLIGFHSQGDQKYFFCESCNKSCFSICKLNNLDSVILYHEIPITVFNNPFIIDNDTIIIFGAKDLIDDYHKSIYKQTIDGEFEFDLKWTEPKNQAVGIKIQGCILYKNKYVSIGSYLDKKEYENGKNKTKGYVSFFNKNGSIDTFLTFTNFHFVRFRDVAIDNDGYLTLLADVVDTDLPDGSQDCHWIIKLNDKKEIIWSWKSDGQLSTPDPGLIRITEYGNILLQNYQKRRGPGFAQTVEMLNEKKEIEWKQFKPWSFNNRYIYQLKPINDEILLSGAFSEINVIPTFYTSKIKNDKLIWDRKYINYHTKDKDIQLTPQSYGITKDLINYQNSILLIGSKNLFYQENNQSAIKEEFDVVLIQTDSFGCVDLDKCNDYYAWGDVPDSLYKYDQIDMKQKECYYSILNNKGLTEIKHLTFGQDSIIFDRLWGDRQYKEVLISDGNKENTILDTLFVRWENTGKLFFIDKWLPKDGVESPADSILYNFTLEVGDKFLLPKNYGNASVIRVDSISLLDGYKRKRLILKHDNPINQDKFGDLVWIEGIGSPNGLFYFYDWISNSLTSIDCYIDRGIKRWGNDENCKPIISYIDTSEFKIGDSWTYSDWIEGECDDRAIFQYGIVADSLIGQKIYSVLAVKENDKIIEESKILLFKKNNKIYFNQNGKDYLLYNFTLNAGDTLNYFIPSNVSFYRPGPINNTGLPKEEQLIIISIDSMVSKEDLRIKLFHTDIPLPYPESNCNTMQTIYNGIGAKNGLFGFPCFFTTEGCYGELRCFTSEDFNLNLTNEDCIPTIISIDTSAYKVGDHWLYTPHSLACQEVLSKVEVLRDTLIENKLCNIIARVDNGVVKKESEVILFYNDSIVSFYEDGGFKLVYDFRNKDIGDTVSFYFPKQAALYDLSSSGASFSPDSSQYKYLVNEKSIVIDENGNTLQRYFIHGVDNETCFVMSIGIIEGVGNMASMFGTGCISLPSGCESYFRCFKGDQFSYNSLNKDCESTATEEIEKSNFSVVPNPNNGSFKIISVIEIDQVNIISLDGKKLKTIENNNEVSISEIVSGLYIIEVYKMNKLIGREKLIKI